MLWSNCRGFMPFRGCGIFAGLVGIIQAVIWVGLSVAFIVIYTHLELRIPLDTGGYVDWLLLHNIYLLRGSKDAFIIYVIMIIYLVLSTFWFVASLNLLLKIVRHRRCVEITCCTHAAYLFWSIVTLLICLLDLVASAVVIYGLFKRFSPMYISVPGCPTEEPAVLGPAIVYPLSTEPDYLTASGRIKDKPLLNEIKSTTVPTIKRTRRPNRHKTRRTTTFYIPRTRTMFTYVPNLISTKASHRRILNVSTNDNAKDEESLRDVINKLLHLPHSIVKKQPQDLQEYATPISGRFLNYSDINVLQVTEDPIILEIKDLDVDYSSEISEEEVTDAEREDAERETEFLPIDKMTTQTVNDLYPDDLRENEIISVRKRRNDITNNRIMSMLRPRNKKYVPTYHPDNKYGQQENLGPQVYDYVILNGNTRPPHNFSLTIPWERKKPAEILQNKEIPDAFSYPFVRFPPEKELPDYSKYYWPLKIERPPELTPRPRDSKPRIITINKNEHLLVTGTMLLLTTRCVIFWIINLICAIMMLVVYCALTRRQVYCDYSSTRLNDLRETEAQTRTEPIIPIVPYVPIIPDEPVCSIQKPAVPSTCDDDDCSCHERFEYEYERFEPPQTYKTSLYKKRPRPTCNIT